MGRKKKTDDVNASGSKGNRDDDDDDEEPSAGASWLPGYLPTRIDPDILELAEEFGLDDQISSKLNEAMHKRPDTWEEDLERLRDVLTDAKSPQAVLAMKIRDMEQGVFAGKARCGETVQEMARKYKLDKEAGTKLEAVMAVREAMGKNVKKDLEQLAVHLDNSNKPSAVISMKLADLRAGKPVGTCVYTKKEIIPRERPRDKRRREMQEEKDMNTDTKGPGGRKILLGGQVTDAELDRRMERAMGSQNSSMLMDEETVRKRMAAERAQWEKQQHEDRCESRSRGRGRRRDDSRSRSRSRRQRYREGGRRR